MFLKEFFNPKSIAVIGASSNKKKIGWQILYNIKEAGFSGKIYPINLKAKTILKEKVYSNLLAVTGKVDLVLIVIPAKYVLREIENCVEKGVKNIVIITAGFKEAGKNGKIMEEKISQLAIDNDLNILGPNCLGFISKENNLNLTFAKINFNNFVNSKISVISQSGAIGSALLDWFAGKKLSLNHFVSLGNEVDLDESDFFNYLIKDKNTDLVIAYLEEIKQGKRTMHNLSKLSKEKPVVVIKAGKSKAGSKMALSHTGSMSGSWQTSCLALERSGAIVLENLEELFSFLNLWMFFVENNKSLDKVFDKSKLFLISNAGGPLVIASDLASEYNFPLANLPKDKFKNIFPKNININNPLDILGDADSVRYKIALNKVLTEVDSNILLIILTPQTSAEPKETAKIILDLQNKYNDKILIPVFIGSKNLEAARMLLEKNNILMYNSFKSLFFSLNKLRNYVKNRKKIKVYVLDNKEKKEKNFSKKDNDKNNKKREIAALDYVDSFSLLKKAGIKVIEAKKINNLKDLKKVKYPIVLKAVGGNLIHKTDKEAISTDIYNFNNAKKEYNRLKKIITDKESYIIYQPCLKSNLELIFGFKRDDNFGNLFMVGWGGIYTEAIKDIAWELGDFDRTRVRKMIEKLKVNKVLSGLRGKKYDIEKIIDIFFSLRKIVENDLKIKEIDINPAFVYENEILVADVRIIK
jgi:acetyltransferase